MKQVHLLASIWVASLCLHAADSDILRLFIGDVSDFSEAYKNASAFRTNTTRVIEHARSQSAYCAHMISLYYIEDSQSFYEAEKPIHEMQKALDRNDVNVLIPNSLSFVNSYKLSDIILTDNADVPIVCSNIAKLTLAGERMTRTFWKTTIGDLVVILFALSDPLDPLTQSASLSRLIEERIKPVQKFQCPDITIVCASDAQIDGELPEVDSPHIDLFVNRSVKVNEIESFQHEYTSNIICPFESNLGIIIDWNTLSKQLVRTKEISTDTIPSVFPSLLGPYLSKTFTLSAKETTQPTSTPIAQFSGKPSIAQTASVFADALRKSAVQHTDFALFPQALINAPLPQNPAAKDLWDIYAGTSTLCVFEAFGADIWQFFSSKFTHRSTQPSGVRISYSEALSKSTPAITNITVCQGDGQWKVLTRSDRFRFVLPNDTCDGIVAGNNTKVHALAFSIPSAVARYCAIYQPAILSTDKRITYAKSGKPFSLPPITAQNCSKHTRWVHALQDCAPCPKGLHQPLPGQTDCVPNRFAFLEDFHFIGFSTCIVSSALVLLCTVLISIAYRRLDHKHTEKLQEVLDLHDALDKIYAFHLVHSREAFFADHAHDTTVQGLIQLFDDQFAQLPHAVQAELRLRKWPKPSENSVNTKKRTIEQLVEGGTFSVDAWGPMEVDIPLTRRDLVLLHIVFNQPGNVTCPRAAYKQILDTINTDLRVIADKYSGILVFQELTSIYVLFDAAYLNGKHMENARHCACDIVQLLRMQAALLKGLATTWLVVGDAGEGAAGVIGDRKYKIYRVVGPIIDRSGGLQKLCLLHNGKFLLTSALHNTNIGNLFERMIWRLVLPDDCCVDIYESLESIDLLPLDRYITAIECFRREDYVAAEEAMCSYMSANARAKEDAVCQTLLEMAKKGKSIAQPIERVIRVPREE